jgi:hypothetical protein
VNALLLAALTLQSEPPILPGKLNLRTGDVIVGTNRQLFSDKAKQIDFELKNRVTLRVDDLTTREGSSNWTFKHEISNTFLRMDDFVQENQKGNDPSTATELRNVFGHQVRYDYIGDDAINNMIINRLMSIPLPRKALKIGGKWTYSYDGFKEYTFSGHYVDHESSKPLIRFTWTGIENPKFFAEGTALIDTATGMPTRINLTAKNVNIPGGELGVAQSMKFDYAMTSFKRAR